MRKPRIGIPLTLDDRERWRADREYHYIDRTYADAVSRAGGLPLHLPIQAHAEEVVDALDGLLLPGGDDFPSQTPLPSHVELDLVPTEQLAFDEALLKAACERGLPVLGICYGMQLMVRAGGGSLDAHLPSQRPESINHRLPADARHPIEIASGSRLAALLGGTKTEVNSLHHQGVRSLGPLEQAVAHGPDGLIEAIEPVRRAAGHAPSTGSASKPDVTPEPDSDSARSPWQIGVQWHPEKMTDDASQRLFAGFVSACREAAALGEERNP